MIKEDFIKYWIDTSEKDWEVSLVLFKQKKYLYSLFFAHLHIEKICKALWVKNNKSDYPPKIHNLNKLLAQAGITLAEEDETFAADINKFNIEGRYPDYVSNIDLICTKDYTHDYLEKIKKLKLCLLSKI
ncbi:MAG: HEPN domain-containing protein [Bacteroidales bacterium]